ncbi:hypothetical protein [Flavobacterium sp.]|uniref:hypothetical protein n=1 Tax=Flavobacterium sp. TaxID=239 RepID=UPI00261EF678|nr:hypothetical protein [Flavobacterium sp.]
MIKVDEKGIQKLLPQIVDWIESQENYIIGHGRDLTVEECALAKTIGIQNYDIIKVLESPNLPVPQNEVLRVLSAQIGLLTPHTAGVCFRYGIYIHENALNKNEILIHELVHTLQYERLGSVNHFIRRYLNECLTIGYSKSQLEHEANTITAKFTMY